MRPRLHDDVADIRYISIHAPLTGCDASSSYVHETWFQISIHAPLTGCDSARRFHWHCCYNFNPRTPYGMRLRGLKDLGLVGSISIHAPLTGCDMIKSYGTCAFYISIHAPLTGCDTFQLIHALSSIYFNPRTPYGMRQEVNIKGYIDVAISIHAPLTGCDEDGTLLTYRKLIFQSTHPLRDATMSI